METTRKGAPQPQRERFLVAMRPEPVAAKDAAAMASLLGMKPELVRDVFGGAWPRIIASRSSLEQAESLARVLTARGRESVAWDRESLSIALFPVERLRVESGRFILEQRGTRRVFLMMDIHRIIDLRLRLEPPKPNPKDVLFIKQQAPAEAEKFPERALLIIPKPEQGDPAVFSTRTVETGNVPVPRITAAQLLQEASVQARKLVPEAVVEMRTTPTALGVEEGDGDPLDRVLELLVRLPPAPVGSLGPR